VFEEQLFLVLLCLTSLEEQLYQYHLKILELYDLKSVFVKQLFLVLLCLNSLVKQLYQYHLFEDILVVCLEVSICKAVVFDSSMSNLLCKAVISVSFEDI
jgi:hypothetical protein